jgi:hypothetical protein
MGVRVEIRKATEEDAAELAARMRPEEVAEVYAMGGVSPLEAITESLRSSDEAWSLLLDGVLACTWGVAPLKNTMLGGKSGVAWLLTTPLIERQPKTFWKACIFELHDLLGRWDELVNDIDARHVKAVRWAKRLGFKLDEARPFGFLRLPFHRFTVRKGDVRWAMQRQA